MRSVVFRAHRWPFANPVMIARGAIREADVLAVLLNDETGFSGRGEAHGVGYCGETPETMVEQVETVRGAIEGGADRTALLSLLPPGGARCAIDAALWDLEAKSGLGDPFARNGLNPDAVATAVTIGIGDADYVESEARRWPGWPLLKIKVGSIDPLAAVDAALRVSPSARLIIDSNQSWSVALLKELAPRLAERGVALLEQPIPVGDEAGLDGYDCPVPMCADELVNDERDLARAKDRFQYVNIKLEKAGGLTAALRLADAAEAQGFGLMVGCMGGSSLAMAPAMVLAQRCAFVDLDGPMLLAADIDDCFEFSSGLVEYPHRSKLWG